MAERHAIGHDVLRSPEDKPVSVDELTALLQQQPEITHVVCVHSETTTGLFNDIRAIGAICRAMQKVFLVDAMSSFGGTDIPVEEWGIHYLVSSSNKCIQGVPGFSFVIAQQELLATCKGQSRTLSLDLYEQWVGLEKNGQFRFTPPTLAIMAFRQALHELKAEGGILAREARYKQNKTMLVEGMIRMGFSLYLRPEYQQHIIVSFLYPASPAFDFDRFYAALNQRGFVIYPGKVSQANAFRIGCIGHLFAEDVAHLLQAVEDVMRDGG